MVGCQTQAFMTPSDCTKAHRVYLSSTTSLSRIPMRHLLLAETSSTFSDFCRLYPSRRLPQRPSANSTRFVAKISSMLQHCYRMYPSRRPPPLVAHRLRSPPPSLLPLHLCKRSPLGPFLPAVTLTSPAARLSAGHQTCIDTPESTIPARNALIARPRAARIPVPKGF